MELRGLILVSNHRHPWPRVDFGKIKWQRRVRSSGKEACEQAPDMHPTSRVTIFCAIEETRSYSCIFTTHLLRVPCSSSGRSRSCFVISRSSWMATEAFGIKGLSFGSQAIAKVSSIGTTFRLITTALNARRAALRVLKTRGNVVLL